MIEGTLDVIAPALLIPYVLLTLALPSWAHWMLIGIATQAMLLLALMVALAAHSPAHMRQRLPSFLSPRLLDLASRLAEGLRAVTSGGLRRCLLVCGQSHLVLALTAAQLTLFPLSHRSLRSRVGDPRTRHSASFTPWSPPEAPHAQHPRRHLLFAPERIPSYSPRRSAQRRHGEPRDPRRIVTELQVAPIQSGCCRRSAAILRAGPTPTGGATSRLY
jgi:hypothetical protein